MVNLSVSLAYLHTVLWNKYVAEKIKMKKKNEKCPWKHLNIVREGEEGISCKLAWLTDWLASGVWDCPFVNERKFPMRQSGDWWKKKSGDMLNLHSHYSFSKTRSITT